LDALERHSNWPRLGSTKRRNDPLKPVGSIDRLSFAYLVSGEASVGPGGGDERIRQSIGRRCTYGLGLWTVDGVESSGLLEVVADFSFLHTVNVNKDLLSLTSTVSLLSPLTTEPLPSSDLSFTTSCPYRATTSTILDVHLSVYKYCHKVPPHSVTYLVCWGRCTCSWSTMTSRRR
jgi:hypothetical protein